MRVRRAAMAIHRSLGVVAALFFLLWFSSGLGMLVWSFPEVTADERLASLPPIDPAAIHAPLSGAASRFAGARPTSIRVNVLDGRPVYRFALPGGERIVYADTGEAFESVSDDSALRIAARWVAQPARTAAMTVLREADQWTVEGTFAPLRPLRVFSWPNGDTVYVSRSGDVVQHTTRASRRGAWLGPIPHWLYFTPLRAHQRLWRQIVLWASGVAAAAAALGLAIGVTLFSPRRTYRRSAKPAAIPYRGPKRWHMTVGLIFGASAIAWAFSGLLSMDPFGAVESDAQSGSVAARAAASLRAPLSLGVLAAADVRSALVRAAPLPITDLELLSFADEPVYLARLPGGETRVLTRDGQIRREFGRDRIAAAVTAAAGPAGATVRVLDRYDAYYRDRRRVRPLPVLLMVTNDAERERVYVDPRTARIVETYRSRDWTSRWLYHGLHSLDLPWLDDHPRLWSLVMLVFMAGGTTLAATSVVLAWLAIRRQAARLRDPALRSAIGTTVE